MSPLRRTALASVVAASLLLALKLVTGLVSGSLGLVSEALHSGTDLVSLAVAGLAVARLTGALEHEIETAWWVFVVLAVVLVIDVSRTTASYRAARRYRSAALLSNALHFGSDLVGTLAVVAGLIAA